MKRSSLTSVCCAVASISAIFSLIRCFANTNRLKIKIRIFSASKLFSIPKFQTLTVPIVRDFDCDSRRKNWNHCTPGKYFVMKFLEYAPLDRLNDFLSNLNLGERTIKGCLETYTCKHAGTDKKLSLSLENEILDYLGKSSDTDSSSPDELLLTRSSRRTLIYLILTLYHMYPDYDFSAVKAHQFFTEESWDSFKQIFDTSMFEASKEWLETNEGVSLLDTLYKAIDEVVKLTECEIYVYDPDSDADPLLERGAIWSFNFFFYNKKLKRIVTFRFSCFSNLVADGFPMDDINEDDGEIFADMDI